MSHLPSLHGPAAQGEVGLLPPPPLQTPPEGKEEGLLPRLPHSHPRLHKPTSTELGGEALCHCLCRKTEVQGALLMQARGQVHPTAGHGGPMHFHHRPPHHSQVHSPEMLSSKDGFLVNRTAMGGVAAQAFSCLLATQS